MIQARLQPWEPSEVIMGCVLAAGLGQAPARQASLGGGISREIPATTINKLGGSGMKAVMLAYDQICAGSAAIMVAGGMESISNVPDLLQKHRGGRRFGHRRTLDTLFMDALDDAFQPGRTMGGFADETAERLQFSRHAQDRFVRASLLRARAAIEQRAFVAETAAIRGADGALIRDEIPARADPEKLGAFEPAFRADGTVTIGNAAAIADGAAALVLMRQSESERRGLTPLAKILGHASHAQLPAWFITAPIGAISKLCDKLGWTIADVDLFEINETFAVVTMAAMRELDLPHDKVNVNGGACALGHPIGASGARILTTLLAALKARGLKRGIAAIAVGGGEATAMAVERFW